MPSSEGKLVTESQLTLLSVLSDGEFHSGESLGQKMQVSRAAIWKQLRALSALGIEVESQKGLGYRIYGGLDLLNHDVFKSLISQPVEPLLSMITIFPVVKSTNQYLLGKLAQGDEGSGALCMAEYQTRGRGRRGRLWQSSYAGSLCLSLAWRFDQGVAVLEGLSLVVGVVICEVLESFGIEGVMLKWPNDLLFQGKKLAGILIEMTGDASGVCDIVVGVGLNIALSCDASEEIDQPWVDLKHIVQGQGLPSRNQLAAGIINRLVPTLNEYQEKGFSAWLKAWEARNAHQGVEVNVITPAKSVSGVVMGVNCSGGLRLNIGGQEKVFLGGEVSLRSGVNAILS